MRKGGERGMRRRARSSVSCLPTPSPPSLSPSLPLTRRSFLSRSFLPPCASLQPVAISDFLGNLRNNTSERAQNSDTHNKPASVTLNPTHKKSSENSFLFSLPLSLSGKRIEKKDLYWWSLMEYELFLDVNKHYGKSKPFYRLPLVWGFSGKSVEHIFYVKLSVLYRVIKSCLQHWR